MNAAQKPTLAGFLRLLWQARRFTPKQRREVADHLRGWRISGAGR